MNKDPFVYVPKQNLLDPVLTSTQHPTLGAVSDGVRGWRGGEQTTITGPTLIVVHCQLTFEP